MSLSFSNSGGPMQEMWSMSRRPRPSLLSPHGVAVLGAIGVALFMLSVMLLVLG